jgi:hypothetical protein
MKCNKLNQKILKTTLLIHSKHPELSKYLEEMPITIPSTNNLEINSHNLESYLNTLIQLMEKYSVSHR